MKKFRPTLLALSLCSVMLSPIAIAKNDTDIHTSLETNQIPSVITLPTIIITAEMLSRTLDKTGSSVEVFGDTALDTRNDIRTITNILQETPNVQTVVGTGKAPTVRGVDGTGPAENAIAFFAGSRPRLNMQLDNRPLTYNEVAFSNYGVWDLEQVEVLRGPQSSLSGRNAMAGTVKINTKKPITERESAVRVESGNFEQKRLSVMHNEPISDTFAVRVSADGFQRQSPVDYDSYEGVDNPAEITGHSLAGKVLFTPNDSKDTQVLLSLVDNEYTSPHTEIVVKPFDKQRSNFPQQAVHKTHVTSAGIDYRSYFTDNLKLEIKGYTSKVNLERKTAPNAGSATIDNKEYAIEPRLHYYHDNGHELVLGARYHDSSQDETMNIFGGLNFTDESKTMAVYGEGLMSFADNYEVIGGVRFEKEERVRIGGDKERNIMNINLDDSYQAILPKIGLNYYPDDNKVLGVFLSRGYNAGGAGITATPPITSYEYKPEYANSIELFGRQTWANKRLKTTQNIFYSQYEDMQLPFDLTPDDSRDEAFTIKNADEVNIYGVELGTTWQQNKHVNVFANLALLNTEITKYNNSGLQGNALFMAPKWSGKIGANVDYQKLHTYINGNFSDGYYTDINNRPQGKTASQATVNVGVAYDIFDNTNIYASVHNVLDNEEPIAKYPGKDESGLADSNADSAVLTQPRMITVGIKSSF